MSYVTDFVFITSSREESEKLQEMVREGYTRYKDSDSDGMVYEPHVLRLEESGPKYTGLFVYHIGFNYMDNDLKDDIFGYPWKPDTVIYTQTEEFSAQVRVVIDKEEHGFYGANYSHHVVNVEV